MKKYRGKLVLINNRFDGAQKLEIPFKVHVGEPVDFIFSINTS